MKTTSAIEKLLNPPISLILKAKERYKEKIKLIENVDWKDSYTLQKEAFTENIDGFPKVTYPIIGNYFLFAPRPLIKEQLKACKSLESYNHFVSGWVKDVGVKLFKNNMLLHGQVSYTFFIYLIFTWNLAYRENLEITWSSLAFW